MSSRFGTILFQKIHLSFDHSLPDTIQFHEIFPKITFKKTIIEKPFAEKWIRFENVPEPLVAELGEMSIELGFKIVQKTILVLGGQVVQRIHGRPGIDTVIANEVSVLVKFLVDLEGKIDAACVVEFEMSERGNSFTLRKG